jgi:glutamine synthetase
MNFSSPEIIEDRLAACEGAERVEAFIVDINAVPRGKWIPISKAATVARKGLPMPRSLYAQDIWGQDVEAAGLAFGTGDPDGFCFPVAHSIAPVTWAKLPTAQMLVSMVDDDGQPFFADPRAMLQRQVEALAARGLTANVAIELEFYLLADGPGAPRPVRLAQPGDGENPFHPGNVLSIESLCEQEGFMNDLAAACRAQGLPDEAILHENSPGQFEVNLTYQPDALFAADQAILLKRAVKAVARQHGMRACFMAKPFGDAAGSGMHVHVSLTDAEGRPFFADVDGKPASSLLHAIGGLAATMGDAMLLAAPHANSYRRFRLNSHAPMTAAWGWGDRTAAIRAIDGDARSIRVEHRVSGADANPYLVAAGVLAGIIEGLDRKIDPGKPQDPRTGTPQGEALPLDWRGAIRRFEASQFIARHFGGAAQRVISACKWQDYDGLLGRIPDTEYETYLGTV